MGNCFLRFPSSHSPRLVFEDAPIGLSCGLQVSGLSKWLGASLAPLQKIPPFAISILLSLLVAMFTECSSNTATTTLFLPILASMVNNTPL